MQNDPILEVRTCRVSGKEFAITQQDAEFYKKISPTFGEYTAEIHFPTLCPEERARRRLLFRNERKGYRRTCDLTQKVMISIYHSDSEYTIYDQKVRRSDEWSPLDYGKAFDFSQSFTEQFGVLLKQVPVVNMINKFSENSEYTNISAYNKNCYLLVESANNEDCMYGYRIQKSQKCFDCAMTSNSELCFASSDLERCYKLAWSQYCRDCADSYMLENCDGCSFCIGCIGLSNAKYSIFNQHATKEQYEQVVQLLLHGDKIEKKKITQRFETLREEYGSYDYIRNSEEVSGDYISDAKQIKDSYEIHDAQDIRYSKHVWFNSRDCMDVDTVGYSSTMVYESINTALESSFDMCCIRCRSCVHCLYCFNCDNSSNLFGCTGLRNKEYCVFNKQYTKEEYEVLVPKIIEHMKTTGERGEFFDPSLSPFGYNETAAQDYYPLSKSQALERKYTWSEYESPKSTSDKVVKGSELPQHIEKIPDDILQATIECEVTGKLFRIQPKELAFYEKYSISLPRKHPDQRHAERLDDREYLVIQS